MFNFISDNNNIKVIFHLGAISATTHKNPNKQWIDNLLFSNKLWRICYQQNIRLFMRLQQQLMEMESRF